MHQSTKKHAFCEDDEWKLTIFLSFSSSFLVLNYVLHCRKHKKILWLLDVCTWRSLLYWLVITRPALFKQNWRPIRTGSCDFKQKEEEDCWRSWTVFFEGSLEIYTACFPLGNTCGLSALLCLLKHVVRSACKGQETTELCFIVVGLLAHMYMWSLNPNYVV